MDTQTFIARQLARHPDLFNRLEDTITPQRAFTAFQRIADTYAPSLIVRYTRGPMVEALLDEWPGLRGDGLRFHGNYARTGNVALELGDAPAKSVWSLAHLDIISFLTGERTDGRYRLTPYCEPRAGEGAREGIALGYSAQTGGLVELTRGQIVIEAGGGIFFETEAQDLPPATRVVYASQAHWDTDTGLIYGAIDNALGAAALVLSAIVLSHYPVEALLVLTDEEEGVVGPGNRAFARGSARLLNRTPPQSLPDLIIVSDLHEPVSDLAQGRLDLSRFGQGALFAGLSSRARGAVTPPPLLTFQRELASFLAARGIQLRENTGYLSRSDDVSAVMFTPNVALIGALGAYSHFADTPRAHINDLVNLAKVLTVYMVLAQSGAWRERYL